jgi:hypothetical protein
LPEAEKGCGRIADSIGTLLVNSDVRPQRGEQRPIEGAAIGTFAHNGGERGATFSNLVNLQDRRRDQNTGLPWSAVSGLDVRTNDRAPQQQRRAASRPRMKRRPFTADGCALAPHPASRSNGRRRGRRQAGAIAIDTAPSRAASRMKACRVPAMMCGQASGADSIQERVADRVESPRLEREIRDRLLLPFFDFLISRTLR